MFSSNKRRFAFLMLLSLLSNIVGAHAEDSAVVSVSTDSLPINAAGQNSTVKNVASSQSAESLVSPSKAQLVQNETNKVANSNQKSVDSSKNISQQPSISADTNKAESPSVASAQPSSIPAKDDFSFDLKLKAVNTPSSVASTDTTNSSQKNDDNKQNVATEIDKPTSIQYDVNPIENLGNSVLSEMDSDLFSQMSEIEKSVTLLTLELRREKIRNEIEAQKAIRLKASADIEKQREAEKLKVLERQKEIEAKVIKERQLLTDKEKLFEVIKQRKLLNAYMNQMLVAQQEWLKEKEALYARIELIEKEKQDLIVAFKQKIDTILTASAKNIQTAEAARVNFERIIKGLKARNEQLRKRIESDAKIIKNAKSNLYLKSQSIEELKDRSVAAANSAAVAQSPDKEDTNVEINEDVEEEQTKLSMQYAILGISGRSGVMFVELIDAQGQTFTLKIGSPLPTGHVVNEIGSDYVKFTRNGQDDYLYVGKTIDGIVPTLGLQTEKVNK